MRGSQHARIGLFLVLIAAGVLVAHVLAISTNGPTLPSAYYGGQNDIAHFANGGSEERRALAEYKREQAAIRHDLNDEEEGAGAGRVSLVSLEESDGGVISQGCCAKCNRANGLGACAQVPTGDAPALLNVAVPPVEAVGFECGPVGILCDNAGPTLCTDFLRIGICLDGDDTPFDCAECPACPADGNCTESELLLISSPRETDSQEFELGTVQLGPVSLTVRMASAESAECVCVGESSACCVDDSKVKVCSGECPACPAGHCSAASACEAAAGDNESGFTTVDLETADGEVVPEPEALRAPDNATEIGPELSTDSREPELLSVPKSDARREAETRAIIARGMPESREDEREIWLEELKGLPPEMVRELLRLRRDFTRSGVPDPVPAPKLADVAPPPPVVAHEEKPPLLDRLPDLNITYDESIAPELFDSSEILVRLEPTLAALRQASRVIVNNIANANTVGFKRSTVLFSNLDYEQVELPGAQDGVGAFSPTGVAIGGGTQISATRIDPAQGPLRHTGRALDLAIIGDGFFQLQDPNGQIVYTRAGSFAKNADGQLVVAGAKGSRPLEPVINVPASATEISISDDGVVSVIELPSIVPSQVGQIQTVRFVNPEGLLPLGDNIFGATDASGAPQVGAPGGEGRGKLKQRHLEGSNVSILIEIAALRGIQQQLQALQQAAAILAPGPALPQGPALDAPAPEPSEEPEKPGRFTRRLRPQQTSEHIRPDRAKR